MTLSDVFSRNDQHWICCPICCAMCCPFCCPTWTWACSRRQQKPACFPGIVHLHGTLSWLQTNFFYIEAIVDYTSFVDNNYTVGFAVYIRAGHESVWTGISFVGFVSFLVWWFSFWLNLIGLACWFGFSVYIVVVWLVCVYINKASLVFGMVDWFGWF